MNEQKFKIEGIHCEACIKLAKIRIGKIEGIQDVDISPDGKASVRADRTIALDEIAKVLDGSGYAVRPLINKG